MGIASKIAIFDTSSLGSGRPCILLHIEVLELRLAMRLSKLYTTKMLCKKAGVHIGASGCS